MDTVSISSAQSHTHKSEALRRVQKEKRTWFGVLIVVGLIPVLCLCGLCIYKVVEAAMTLKDAKSTVDDTKNWIKLDSLLRALQRERRISDRFILTGGFGVVLAESQEAEIPLGNRFERLRRQTDEALQEVDLSPFKISKPEIDTKEKLISSLNTTRQQVGRLRLTLDESYQAYSDIIETLAKAGDSSLKVPQGANNKNMWRLMVATLFVSRASRSINDQISHLTDLFLACDNSRDQLAINSDLEGRGDSQLKESWIYYPALRQNYTDEMSEELQKNLTIVREQLLSDDFRDQCRATPVEDRSTGQYPLMWPHNRHNRAVSRLRVNLYDNIFLELDELISSAENEILIYILILSIVVIASVILLIILINFLSNLIDRVMVFTKRAVKLRQSVASLKKKEELLLLNLLPRSIAETLVCGNDIIPSHHDHVTICYVDLHDFMTIQTKLGPFKTGTLLADIAGMVDQTILKHDVYKLEFAMNDTFVISSGVPEPTAHHAKEMANFALDLMREIKQFTMDDTKVQIKIGLHSGQVAAGVIGRKVPRYSVFGESVKMADRMCHSSPVNGIQMSEATKTALDKSGTKFNIVLRGKMDIRGLGSVNTYFLNDN